MSAILRKLAPLVAFSACFASGAPAETPQQSAQTAERRGLAPAGTVADLFGINEAVAIPARLVHDLTPEQRSERLDRRVALVKVLGVRHVRVHSASWPFLSYDRGGDVSAADELLAKLFAAGLEPVVIVGPWPGNAPAAVTERYVPRDLDGYAKWLSQTVERYDGDGVDDAPNLGGAVHTWEVDNEPDLHHVLPPKDGGPLIDGFESPADYAQVAIRSVEAIHAADPTARVLPAGLYAPTSPRMGGYAGELWREPGFADSFEDVNLHAYPGGAIDGVWPAVDRLWELAPKTHAWITETSVTDEAGEREQAVALAELYLEGLRRGVERIYWHSLTEAPFRPAGPRARPAPTQGHHLYAAAEGAEPRPKLAGKTMAKMIARWGDVSRASVREFSVEGGRGLVLGDDWVVFRAVGGPAGVATLRLADGEVRLSPLVDADAASGGTAAIWSEHAQQVKGQTLAIDLAGGPVRVSGGQFAEKE